MFFCDNCKTSEQPSAEVVHVEEVKGTEGLVAPVAEKQGQEQQREDQTTEDGKAVPAEATNGEGEGPVVEQKDADASPSEEQKEQQEETTKPAEPATELQDQTVKEEQQEAKQQEEPIKQEEQETQQEQSAKQEESPAKQEHDVKVAQADKEEKPQTAAGEAASKQVGKDQQPNAPEPAQKDMQQPPKQEAAVLKSKKLESFLSSKGYGDVNSKRTTLMRYYYPLHDAVISGDAELVRELLAAKADPALKSSSGKTPLQRAQKLNTDGSRDDMCKVLGAAGVVPAAEAN